MLVTLRTLNQQTFKIEVDPEEKVVDLKKKIENMKGTTFAVANQKLIYAGKILSDDSKISGCEIDENEYIVLMVLQVKASPTTEQTPSAPNKSTPTQVNGASGSKSVTASSTESSKPKEGSASTPSTESNLVTGDKFEDLVKQIMEMGYGRVEVEVALKLSFNNPERAVEYLINGLPSDAPVNGTNPPESGGLKTPAVENGSTASSDPNNLSALLRSLKAIDQVDQAREEAENHDFRKGEMYLKKLEETIAHIKVEIEKTKEILANESHLMNEEINGNLLSSIGKGNLLIAQKLNQFRELCHKNINGNHFEQFSTKNEDLDGFWEMVYIQVEDVLNGFQEIYKLKQNNWIIITNNKESPTITIPKIRSPRKVNATSKTSPNQQQSTPTTRNTARDEMRKQRLREAKLKSQSRLQEMKQSDDDVVIFVPPSNPADLLINNHGSKIES